MGKDPVGVTPAGFCIEGKGSGFKVQGSRFRGEAAHFVILSGEIKNGLSEIGELSRRI